MIECDVLVVGAGPAGASAARAASLGGARTVLIDKKKEIGVPVQCGEAVGKFLLPFLPFNIPYDLFTWNIKGISFFYEDLMVNREGGLWSGYSINREELDKWLFKEALAAGTKAMNGCELIELDLNEESTADYAFVNHMGENKKIKFKILIGCDGVFSDVREFCKIQNEKLGSYASVYAWEIDNLNIKHPNLEQIYVGEFTPSGYAYIFPKSKKKANVGIGGIFPEKKLEYYFSEFLEEPNVKKQVSNGKKISDKSGYAPFAGFGDVIVHKNVLLAGDAANQNIKPFIEGILPAIICGYFCGEIVGKAIKDNNINILNQYTGTINSNLGEVFKENRVIVNDMIKLFKMRDLKKYPMIFALAAGIIDSEDINSIIHMNAKKISKDIKERVNRCTI